jgi:hypothetical protein
MAKRVAKKRNGVDKLISEISRTDSLDWHEFNFFKGGAGLSRNDQLSIQVCLDYELAREWRRLVEWLKNCSEKQRQDVLSMPESRRYAAIPFASPFDPVDMPPVPTACIAAPWFPSPWLSGPARERENIVKKLAESYDSAWWFANCPGRYGYHGQPLSVYDFPVDDQRRLAAWTAEKNSGRTLHVFEINRKQTKSAIIAAFKQWIEWQPDISGKESLRGRVKAVAALRDLGCYRLMTKLDALSRQVAMDEAGFKQSVPKLSEAKRRTQKRLRSMGYI